MAPPSKARPRVAYDLGRRGESLPDDWHDDPELAGAYELGVDDRDASLAGSKRRHGPPEQRRSAESDDTGSTKTGKGERKSRRERARQDVHDSAVPFSSHPLTRGSTGGGLVLGVGFYAMGRVFLTEGPHGIWRWYSAKFMNKVLPRRAGVSSPATPSRPQPTPQPQPSPTPAVSTGSGRVVQA